MHIIIIGDCKKKEKIRHLYTSSRTSYSTDLISKYYLTLINRNTDVFDQSETSVSLFFDKLGIYQIRIINIL